MRILRYMFVLLLPMVIFSHAYGAQTPMKGESKNSVRIDKEAYGMTSFYCNAKQYYTDVHLPNFQGCYSEDISFGAGGLDAKLLTVYYGWEDLPGQVKQSKSLMFVEKPDGELYRLKSTKFLTSLKLQRYFDNAYGRGHGSLGPSDVNLENFSVRNIQSYGNTFCVMHYLKYPFTGTMGWCQNDSLVGGEVGYLDGAMTFSRAAILAQNYINEHKLKIKGGKLFHPETAITLRKDKHDIMYWGFGVPAEEKHRLASYGFRVYFNGTVFANELQTLPTLNAL